MIETTKKFKRITPITDIAMIQMTCHLLDYLLSASAVPSTTDVGGAKEWQEIYFVFAIIWGFGSTFYQDQIIDWRNEFNKFWLSEFKTIPFPADGSIFDYYIEPKYKVFRPWSDLVPKFELDVDIPLQVIFLNCIVVHFACILSVLVYTCTDGRNC